MEAIDPVGLWRARYSPSLESLKLVWSSSSGSVRSLEEAKTSVKPPGAIQTDEGKVQLRGSYASSVRCQPPRAMEEEPGL